MIKPVFTISKSHNAAAAKSLQSCPTLCDPRRQPTRLPRPWGSPGKNTGVGCHSPLQCMKVKSESEVAQSCPTTRNPMDCSPPGSFMHGIFQAGVLEWAILKRTKQPTAWHPWEELVNGKGFASRSPQRRNYHYHLT